MFKIYKVDAQNSPGGALDYFFTLYRSELQLLSFSRVDTTCAFAAARQVMWSESIGQRRARMMWMDLYASSPDIAAALLQARRKGVIRSIASVTAGSMEYLGLGHLKSCAWQQLRKDWLEWCAAELTPENAAAAIAQHHFEPSDANTLTPTDTGWPDPSNPSAGMHVVVPRSARNLLRTPQEYAAQPLSTQLHEALCDPDFIGIACLQNDSKVTSAEPAGAAAPERSPAPSTHSASSSDVVLQQPKACLEPRIRFRRILQLVVAAVPRPVIATPAALAATHFAWYGVAPYGASMFSQLQHWCRPHWTRNQFAACCGGRCAGKTLPGHATAAQIAAAVRGQHWARSNSLLEPAMRSPSDPCAQAGRAVGPSGGVAHPAVVMDASDSNLDKALLRQPVPVLNRVCCRSWVGEAKIIHTEPIQVRQAEADREWGKCSGQPVQLPASGVDSISHPVPLPTCLASCHTALAPTQYTAPPQPFSLLQLLNQACEADDMLSEPVRQLAERHTSQPTKWLAHGPSDMNVLTHALPTQPSARSTACGASSHSIASDIAQPVRRRRAQGMLATRSSSVPPASRGTGVAESATPDSVLRAGASLARVNSMDALSQRHQSSQASPCTHSVNTPYRRASVAFQRSSSLPSRGSQGSMHRLTEITTAARAGLLHRSHGSVRPSSLHLESLREFVPAAAVVGSECPPAKRRAGRFRAKSTATDREQREDPPQPASIMGMLPQQLVRLLAATPKHAARGTALQGDDSQQSGDTAKKLRELTPTTMSTNVDPAVFPMTPSYVGAGFLADGDEADNQGSLGAAHIVLNSYQNSKDWISRTVPECSASYEPCLQACLHQLSASESEPCSDGDVQHRWEVPSQTNSQQQCTECKPHWPQRCVLGTPCQMAYFCGSNTWSRQPFLVAVDHAARAVVLSIRGTTTGADVVSDLYGIPCSAEVLGNAFGFDGTDRVLHGGFLANAATTYMRLQATNVLRSLLHMSPEGRAAYWNLGRWQQQLYLRHMTDSERRVFGVAWDQPRLQREMLCRAHSRAIARLQSLVQLKDQQAAEGAALDTTEQQAKANAGAAGQLTQHFREETKVQLQSSDAEITTRMNEIFVLQQAAIERYPDAWYQSPASRALLACPHIPDVRGYRLVVTGHSLGAAVASLISLMLRQEFDCSVAPKDFAGLYATFPEIFNSVAGNQASAKAPAWQQGPPNSTQPADSQSSIQQVSLGPTEGGSAAPASREGAPPVNWADRLMASAPMYPLHCLAYSCPGTVCGGQMGSDLAEFTTSVVLGGDMVPRSSARSVQQMTDEALTEFYSVDASKAQIICGLLWCGHQRFRRHLVRPRAPHKPLYPERFLFGSGDGLRGGEVHTPEMSPTELAAGEGSNLKQFNVIREEQTPGTSSSSSPTSAPSAKPSSPPDATPSRATGSTRSGSALLQGGEEQRPPGTFYEHLLQLDEVRAKFDTSTWPRRALRTIVPFWIDLPMSIPFSVLAEQQSQTQSLRKQLKSEQAAYLRLLSTRLHEQGALPRSRISRYSDTAWGPESRTTHQSVACDRLSTGGEAGGAAVPINQLGMPVSAAMSQPGPQTRSKLHHVLANSRADIPGHDAATLQPPAWWFKAMSCLPHQTATSISSNTVIVPDEILAMAQTYNVSPQRAFVLLLRRLRPREFRFVVPGRVLYFEKRLHRPGPAAYLGMVPRILITLFKLLVTCAGWLPCYRFSYIHLSRSAQVADDLARLRPCRAHCCPRFGATPAGIHHNLYAENVLMSSAAQREQRALPNWEYIARTVPEMQSLNLPFRPVWANQHEMGRIILSGSMFNHHRPYRVVDEMYASSYALAADQVKS